MNDSAIASPMTGGTGHERVDISFVGRPWSLVGLGIYNTLLSLLTLGVYSFWGRTEVRKRLWSMVRVNGEPLEYTGTGKELFLGFLIVFAVVLLPYIIAYTAALIWLGPVIAVLVLFSAYIVIGYLFGVGIYRARRYRLSRTRWRGIRGALIGSDWRYAWGYFWTAIVSGLTGGWLHPWRTNFLYRNITNDTRFGDRPFSYDGQAGPLYPPFALAWVGGILAYIGILGGIFGYLYGVGKFPLPNEDGTTPPQIPPTLVDNLIMFLIVVGMVLFFSLFIGWYQARATNVLTRGTMFDGLKFKADVNGAGMIWMFVSNYLMTLLSFGALKPVADARNTKYLIDRLSTDGTVDFGLIAQSQAAMEARGEGIATAFDLDAIG